MDCAITGSSTPAAPVSGRIEPRHDETAQLDASHLHCVSAPGPPAAPGPPGPPLPPAPPSMPSLRMMRRPDPRSEEHTSELQSQSNLVCRLLLEKKNPRTR